ncbi:MAG TPA: TonB-dependent receptor, partial [Rubricoccaceae bacterium]|nr:TonB-dependent receptor [Rubricoccaceae bacterium]
WGNASGGVLALSTFAPGRPSAARLRQTVGAYGLTKTDAQAMLSRSGRSLSAFVSYLDQGGYRAHSEHRALRAGFSGRLPLGSHRVLQAVGVVAHVPVAEAPGSLTQALVEADPRQADPRSVPASTGKAVDQGQLGLTYSQALGSATVRATAYGVYRRLENALPFAFIDLDRHAGGVRLVAEGAVRGVAWGIGAEADGQRDDRVEYDNVGGSPGSEVQLYQRETATNQAAFAHASAPLGPVRVSGGARLDRIRYEADDRLGSGDGGQTFHAVSPSLGVVLPFANGRLFASVATALDAPTTQELGNRPDGQGGFNLDLHPERAVGMEAGASGRLPAGRIGYDVALFALRVEDMISPYELEDGGPTLYRNEGTTRHAGVEVALTGAPSPGLSFAAAYTYLDAAFTGGPSEGREVPGVPAHRVSGALDVRRGPLWLTLEAEAASGFYVDSENTARNGGFIVAHARLSHTGVRLGRGITLTPFIAARNVTDERYNGSVVVNAAGGRYYEPAAGRHGQAGLTLTLD